MSTQMLCFSYKTKTVLVIFVTSFILNLILYNFYIRPHKQPLYITNGVHEDERYSLSVDIRSPISEGKTLDKVYQPKNMSIGTLTKELQVPYSGWMDQQIVNQFDYRLIHNPHLACYEKRKVELFIAIPVSRTNFQQRQTIRETWGSYVSDPNISVVLLFFIGNGSKTESPDIQKRIDQESAQYGDIVQGEYLDTYRNLSLKSVSILSWFDTFCPEADYLTKADDDMYIVIPNLLYSLKDTSKKHVNGLFVFGFLIINAVPVQNINSKWYTPKYMFSEKVYPKYVSGTSYSMTGKAARFLFHAALRTPLFWLEDIYITGMCARKADILLINSNRHTYKKPKATGCQFKKYITGHRYSPNEIRKIHRELHDKDLRCS